MRHTDLALVIKKCTHKLFLTGEAPGHLHISAPFLASLSLPSSALATAAVAATAGWVGGGGGALGCGFSALAVSSAADFSPCGSGVLARTIPLSDPKKPATPEEIRQYGCVRNSAGHETSYNRGVGYRMRKYQTRNGDNAHANSSAAWCAQHNVQICRIRV